MVFNGWAAGPETWALCTFEHDWVFDYVEQLDGLPEKIIEEFDEVLLVGFSMGGSTALRMVLKYPEKVKGLVLVSATPCMMEKKVEKKKVEKKGGGGEGGEGESGVGGEGEEDWKGMSERRLAALRLGTQMVFKDDPSPMYDERNMERGLDYLKQTDLRHELLSVSESVKRWNFPVWIFQSERDGIVRPNNAAFLKQVFPQAKVTMVPGNEHVLPITVPELIDAAVGEIPRRFAFEPAV